jgi:hypothetical protein
MSLKRPNATRSGKTRSFEVLLTSPEEPAGIYSATIKALNSPTDFLEGNEVRFAESVLDLVGDLLIELIHSGE